MWCLQHFVGNISFLRSNFKVTTPLLFFKPTFQSAGIAPHCSSFQSLSYLFFSFLFPSLLFFFSSCFSSSLLLSFPQFFFSFLFSPFQMMVRRAIINFVESSTHINTQLRNGDTRGLWEQITLGPLGINYAGALGNKLCWGPWE